MVADDRSASQAQLSGSPRLLAVLLRHIQGSFCDGSRVTSGPPGRAFETKRAPATLEPTVPPKPQSAIRRMMPRSHFGPYARRDRCPIRPPPAFPANARVVIVGGGVIHRHLGGIPPCSHVSVERTSSARTRNRLTSDTWHAAGSYGHFSLNLRDLGPKCASTLARLYSRLEAKPAKPPDSPPSAS